MSTQATPDVSELVVPDNFSVEWGYWGWMATRKDGSASFVLSNRTFGDLSTDVEGDVTDDIDHHTGKAISESIEEVIERKGRAVVVDVACGPLNKAAVQIAETYRHKVSVVAVDIIGHKYSLWAPNLKRITADASSMPLRTGFADVVYSMNFMEHVPHEERLGIFAEIGRILAPDGHAVLGMIRKDPLENQWYTSLFPYPTMARYGGIIQLDDMTLHLASITHTPGDRLSSMQYGSQPLPYIHMRKSNSSENIAGIFVNEVAVKHPELNPDKFFA